MGNHFRNRLFTSVATAFLLAVPAVCQTRPDHSREFDFWIGEWDVNLRVRQPDGTWKDRHKAVDRIYSILNGKAILELWSEGKEGINGYSLRYYNPEKKKWDLWLNWAGKNRSGTHGLEGEFRHGRGEFFAERKQPDGSDRISRYTFSDITPNSLRWDDGYSTDGGKTWSSNWIMEFTRTADKPPAIGTTKNLLTYFDGSRCDLPEFDVLSALVSKRKQDRNLRLHNILDGCIVAGFLTEGETSAFLTLTYNTYAKTYEFAYLDSSKDGRLALYYGPKTDLGFEMKNSEGGEAKISIGNDYQIENIELDYGGKRISFGLVRFD